MAVAVQSAGVSNTGGSSSFSVNAPSGIAVGDLLLALLTEDTGTTRVTTYTGWTPVSGTNLDADGANDDTASVSQYLYRIADASDVGASSYSFQGSSVWTGVQAILRITGHDATTPIDGATSKDSASGTGHTSNSLTPSVAGCLLVTHPQADGTNAQNWSSTDAGAEWVDQYDPVAFVSAAVYASVYGLTDPVTRSATFSQSRQAVITLLAIRPAGASPVSVTPGPLSARAVLAAPTAGLAAAPAALSVTATALAPTVEVAAAVSVAPAPLAARAVLAGPAAGLAVAPAPLTARAVLVSPAVSVSGGAVAVAPAPLFVTATALAPTAEVAAAVSVAPAPLATRAVLAGPVVTAGAAVSVAPAPLAGQAVLVAPVVNAGGAPVAVAPGPLAARAVLLAPAANAPARVCLVITRDGLRYLLRAKIGGESNSRYGLASLTIRLFVAPHEPDQDDTADDYVEASFPGYTRRALDWWSPPNPEGSAAATYSRVLTWTLAAGPGQTVHGWYALSPSGFVVMASRLSGGPRVLSAPGDDVRVQVRVEDRSISEGG